MGFWSGIFGAGGASFPTGAYQPLPPPPPPPAGYTTSTSLAQAPQIYANSQLAAQQRSYGGKGVGGVIGPQGMVYRIDEDLQKLTRYAEMCGDTVEVVELADGEETDDVKVALLKAADVGKVVKSVGMKLTDNRFAVYREQGE